ncbi:MAG: hypothetical protein IPN29_07060 [Saprospiraceae bacterium]|nr:hypothetical protein [Saprospiraceae bacterium]
MIFLYSISFFLTSLILANPCHASDSWSLQYVTIQLKNGQRLHGYICLNEQSLRQTTEQWGIRATEQRSNGNSFLDSLLVIYRMGDSLQVYSDLFSDKTILDGIMLSKQKPVKVPIEQVTSIRRTNGQYNGMSGSWKAINVVNEKELELLAQKPYYFYISDSKNVYLTLLSYHQAFKASNLQKISEQLVGLEGPQFEAARENYRSKNIIVLRFD